MSNKKSVSIKTVSILLVLVLLMGLAVGGTVAWLAAETTPVINTFTYGDIDITLEETDTNLDGDNDINTNEYVMIPGKEITKDPKLTVLANSENCWVFVKLEETGGGVIADNPQTAENEARSWGFDDYMEYEMFQHDDVANNKIWTLLKDENGTAIYYGIVTKPAADLELKVLKDDKVTVKNSVTKEMVNALDDNGTAAAGSETYPKLTITGYAVQHDAAATPEEAWKLAESKGVPAQNPPVTP